MSVERTTEINMVAEQLAADFAGGLVRKDALVCGRLPGAAIRQFMALRLGKMVPPLTESEAVTAFDRAASGNVR
ncbi:MAG: hypothetical protein KJ947_22575 [Alphaproteobacteria bacterium]|nr:hypothetical protein [Alphaproteobacteria bacterium]MBU1552332.1 hypothetical protein [Alphaproteobacteria bacterium]MBU2334525.1 hypothetical protein [Alphaproteobacteria bacterium]MBU2388335.1 hypothetical protein [Alphaproteobacteria bacterium]